MEHLGRASDVLSTNLRDDFTYYLSEADPSCCRQQMLVPRFLAVEKRDSFAFDDKVLNPRGVRGLKLTITACRVVTVSCLQSDSFWKGSCWNHERIKRELGDNIYVDTPPDVFPLGLALPAMINHLLHVFPGRGA